MITQQELLEMFEYRDGDLYWKINIPFNNTLGKKAGGLFKNIYYQTRVNGRIWRNHRIIFLMHHGWLPKEIDHIDGNGLNNRIENLRAATRSENCMNRKTPNTNNSGIKNVSWDRHHKKWLVQIQFNGKKKHIGRFEDIELAELVAIMAREKYHGKFAL